MRRARRGGASESAAPAVVETREDVLAAPIIKAARALGWLCYHDHDSRGLTEGRPDWEFLWPATAGRCPGVSRHLWAEMKAGTRRSTDAQSERLANLRAAGEWAEEIRVDKPFDVARLRVGLGLSAQARNAGNQSRAQVVAKPGASEARIAELVAAGHGRAAAERIAAAELRDAERRVPQEVTP